MRLRRALLAALLIVPLMAPAALAQGFKFSDPDPIDQQEKADKAAAQAIAVEQIWTPCRAELKDKKIMVVIGERRSDGYIYAEQQNYGAHYEAINRRLKTLGLRTYTPEEIRRQIAQAEIDAYFKNDPDAALSASKRLGASFVLRGLITSQAMQNPMMRVNQVTINMDFTLTGSNGRLISDAQASSSSYAGADVNKMALTLVNEKADEVVPKLYADYCRNAGPRPANRPAPKK
jgi:hypothetical protein